LTPLLVTLAAGDAYLKMVEVGIENKLNYCKKHDYLFVPGYKLLDNSRPAPWSKILLILEVFENPDIKWVFWSDADSLIMNSEIKLESYIDESYEFIVTQDRNGLNSGQFFIKNSPWARIFLSKIYERTDCIFHPWWEQQAIIDEYNKSKEIQEKTKILPQRSFNSYPSFLTNSHPDQTYKRGDFLIHFPSVRGSHLSQNMLFFSKLSR